MKVLRITSHQSPFDQIHVLKIECLRENGYGCDNEDNVEDQSEDYSYYGGVFGPPVVIHVRSVLPKRELTKDCFASVQTLRCPSCSHIY